MKRALALPFLLLGLLVQSSAADAQSFHEELEATPISKDKQVVGLRLKITLRPDSYSKQTKVRVGLGPMTPKPAGASYDWHRPLASDASKGYLVHQFAEIAMDLEKDTNGKTVTLEVLYTDAPELKKLLDKTKGVLELEVISAWNAPTNETYWHVWGIQSIVKDPKSVIKVPKPKAPAAKPAKESAPAAAKETAAKEAKPAATRKPRAAKPKPSATSPKPRRTAQQMRTAQRRVALKGRARVRR